MIQPKLFFCADNAALDGRYNTISAFHILEEVGAATFPLVVPRLAIIGMFSREETDPINIELQLQVTLGAAQLLVASVPLNFAHQLRTRAILELNGFLLPTPGLVVFSLRHGESLLTSWSIRANQVGQPSVQLSLPQVTPPQAG